jgi:ribosomal protein S18 acetylase RimI-like enzyme
MIDIRPAAPADADALAALRWEFRGGRQPTIETREDFVARCSAWMRAALAPGGPAGPWSAWIAETDRRAVGQVWLQIFSKLPNPNGEGRFHAYVSNLYVQPAARGGVGSRLLEAAVAHAKANGVDRIVLWPTDRSVPLYIRRGFRREGGVMELML